MRLPEFALERWFAPREFVARHMLCSSAVEDVTLAELLALADDESRALWDGLGLGYTETAGHPLLRAEIAALYSGLTADDVLVCAGSEAILLVLSTAVGPGDHAVCLRPAYQSLHEVLRAAGADVTFVDVRHAGDAGWRVDLDEVQAAIGPRTRAVVVNLPHNPTGATLDRAGFAHLVAMADAAGATLVSDEVYRELEHRPEDRLPAAVERSDRAVSISVLSKAYGLAGLRMGWIATRDRALLARAAAMKDYTSLCAPAPSEILAIVALRARATLLDRARAIVAANLPPVEAFMAEHRDAIDWTPPRAGPVAFPRMLLDRPVERVADELLAAEGVLILPGTVFGDRDNRFRLGLGRHGVEASLAGFGRYLAAA